MKRLSVLSIVFFLSSSAYGMFGGGYGNRTNDTLYDLMRTLGANRVDQIMKTLDRSLTPHEAAVLRAEIEKNQQESRETTARYEAQSATQRTHQLQNQQQEETKRATINADRDKEVAAKNAIAANAKALEEANRRERVKEEQKLEAQKHQEKLQEIETQKNANNDTAEFAAGLETKSKKEAIDHEITQKKIAKEAERAAQEQAQKEAIEREKQAQDERIKREQEFFNKKLEEQQKAELERINAQTEADLKKIEAESRAKLKHDTALKDKQYKDWQNQTKQKAMREMADAEAERNKDLKTAEIKTKIEEWKKATFEFMDDKDRQKKVGTFIAATTVVTAGGILAFRYGLPIVQEAIRNRLFTPDLIEESSKTGLFGSLFSKKKFANIKLNNLYFDKDLQEKVDEIKTTLVNTKKNKGFYLNYLFYGKPGTGKTATARALAYESGMDFAFMTGGSVLDLLRSGKAIQRLKEVFNWAKKSKKGLVLFIDEADAFLANPNGDMSEELNSVLKAFLNYTGTEK